MKTFIEIDGKKHEIAGGLVSAKVIYELAGCAAGRLFVNRSDDMDMPLDSASFVVIQGNEVFITGESQIADNPPLRTAIQVRFNGETDLEIPRAIITGSELKAFDNDHPQGRLFADIDIGSDVEITDEMRILVQEGNAFFVIPAGDGSGVGDPIDIEDCSKHGRSPPKGQKYRIRIDRQKYLVEEEKITGAQILLLADKNSEEWALNQKLSGGKRERIKADDFVDVSQSSVERFETVRRQAQQGRD